MKKIHILALLLLGGMVGNSYAQDDAEDARWSELPEHKRRTRQAQSEAAKRRNQRRLDMIKTGSPRPQRYDTIRTSSPRPGAQARMARMQVELEEKE